MNTKLYRFLIVSIFAICMTFTSAAMADTSTPTSTPAQITNESISYSSASLQNEQTVSINATEHGALEVKAEMPKLNEQISQHVTNEDKQEIIHDGETHNTRLEHIDGYVCRWGIAIWSPSLTSAGLVWIQATGRSGWTHGCLVHGVWRQILGFGLQWNCANAFHWANQPLPPHAVTYTGKFVIVTHFTFTANIKATAEVSATLSATASCNTAGSSAGGSGSVTGYGYAIVTFSASGSTRAQALAKASSEKVSTEQSESLQGSAKANAELQLNAAAWAKCSSSTPPPAICTDTAATNYGGSLPCVYSPPTATCQDTTATNYGQPLPCTYPPNHWVLVSCTGFEEITGGGSFIVKCAVSDDDGLPISLAANATNQYSQVSGINCFSNGGSQTCPSGGTFEFRVDGENDTSDVQQSSVTVVASDGEVSDEFDSDPYNVDQSDGGF